MDKVKFIMAAVKSNVHCEGFCKSEYPPGERHALIGACVLSLPRAWAVVVYQVVYDVIDMYCV